MLVGDSQKLIQNALLGTFTKNAPQNISKKSTVVRVAQNNSYTDEGSLAGYEMASLKLSNVSLVSSDKFLAPSHQIMVTIPESADEHLRQEVVSQVKIGRAQKLQVCYSGKDLITKGTSEMAGDVLTKGRKAVWPGSPTNN